MWFVSVVYDEERREVRETISQRNSFGSNGHRESCERETEIDCWEGWKVVENWENIKWKRNNVYLA